MATPRIGEQENFVSAMVTAYFEDQELGLGTGFHYHHLGSDYFITNWHIVTGRHPESGKADPVTLGVPSALRIEIPVRASDDGNAVTLGWRTHIVLLYSDDERRKPVWMEHPSFGRKVDVVALQVGGLSATAFRHANAQTGPKPKLRAGMDVFVLGFPRGLTGSGKFPIWKRGSIATEPDLDLNGLPMLYIDTATRKGMSGSPVFAADNGTWWTEADGDARSENRLGPGRRFLGCYSGRVGTNEMEAQLGIVWKERAIVEVIEGGKVGESSLNPALV